MASLLSVVLLIAQAAFAQSEKPAYGILMLAHGGGPRWNKEVTALRDQVNAKIPAEVSFGMAIGGAQVREIQDGVDRLERRSVRKIVAVPLFISSDSEVMDQVRYALGITDTPSKTLAERMRASGHEHRYHREEQAPKSPFKSTYLDVGGSAPKQVKTRVPLVLMPALDDHTLVGEILADRAKALSKEPGRETVFLVAHGPVEDDKNRAWLETLGRLGADLKTKGGFKDVKAATLRDDAPYEVRDQAAKELRERVAAAARGGGRVLVIPHLIAQGGIESHITRALDGLLYAWDGKPLLPHKVMPDWVLQTAAEGAKKDDMRKSK